MKSTTEKSRDKENKKKEMVTFGGGGGLSRKSSLLKWHLSKDQREIRKKP